MYVRSTAATASMQTQCGSSFNVHGCAPASLCVIAPPQRAKQRHEVRGGAVHIHHHRLATVDPLVPATAAAATAAAAALTAGVITAARRPQPSTVRQGVANRDKAGSRRCSGQREGCGRARRPKDPGVPPLRMP